MRNCLQAVRRMSFVFMFFLVYTNVSAHSLSESLYLPLPSLPTSSQNTTSIQIWTNSSSINDDADEISLGVTSKWEDEEERRFFEDIQDLRDLVPRSILGIEDKDSEKAQEEIEEAKKREEEEVRKLEEELEGLKVEEKKIEGSGVEANGNAVLPSEEHDNEDIEDEGYDLLLDL